ncbi:MAG: alkylmercury lyase [Gemmatimonadetes bacterium]|nr:alkylmercury lyase [Gemmatimonadota bacterium]
MSVASRIELVHHEGCGHVDRARESLAAALRRRGLPPRWTEWRTGDPYAPERVRRLPSPTVLVDGVDVQGASGTAGEADACRVHLDDLEDRIVDALAANGCGERA